jgi:glycosyltransferase involved in cell wall biosynthesis
MILVKHKIAIFLATSGHSGVDRLMKNLIREFIRLGLKIDLIQIEGHGPFFSHVPQGLRIVRLPAKHVYSAFFPLVGYLKKERPCVILSDKDRVNRMVILARMVAGVPNQVIVRTGTTVSMALAGKGLVERSIQKLSYRFLYKLAQGVLVPSQGAADDLAALSGLDRSRIKVVPTPVFHSGLADLYGAPPPHPWFALNHDIPIIIGIGELSSRKRFHTLVEAFIALHGQMKCRLVILGEGKERPRLEKRLEQAGVSQDAWLPGFAKNPFACLVRADVFVMTSRLEGMPVVLLEALGAGLPVVATDCPSGPREVLEGCGMGTLIPVGDTAQLTHALQRILTRNLPKIVPYTYLKQYTLAHSAHAYLKAMGVTGDGAFSRPVDIAILGPMGRSGETAHGGITPVVCHLAREFRHMGISVELVTFFPPGAGSILSRMVPEFPVHNLGPGTKIYQAFLLSRYLRKRRPRVLLSAGPRANLISALTKKMFRPKTRIILGVHNIVGMAFRGLSPLTAKWRTMRLRWLYKQSDGIICVSKGVVRDLKKILDPPDAQVHVIHNPIFSPDFLQKADQPIPHPWFNGSGPPVILGAGRLTPQKDFPCLLKAFARVRKQMDCRLVILGRGEQKQRLLALAQALHVQDAFDLPGFVDSPGAYMKKSSVFVLSSQWEGFGNVLVEAMALGTPVIATDCPHGPAEILMEGRIGTLIPPGRPDLMAEAILETLRIKPDTKPLMERAAVFSANKAALHYRRYLLPPGTMN